MKVLQNLYYIMKIDSNKILNMKKYSFKDAKANGDIVAVGDNLVLNKIRQFNGDHRDHIEIFNYIESLQKNKKKLKGIAKTSETIQEIENIQNKIDDILFVDDIINVKVIKKKEYKEIGRNGFNLNGKHYVRFCCGSGQMRRNTVTFINDKLYDDLQKKLMCGLEGSIRNINLAKLSAYFALSFSSVLWVRNPRVCIVKDFDTIVPNQSIDYIYKDKNGENQIEERVMDLKYNSSDGQGLISPEMADLWASDMHLDYTPCSFVVRTAFIKGNLVTFDFHEYAKENNITTITDRYGTTYNVEEIDVLISESQFKMYKYYSSWEVYESYHKEYDLKWGVARYNKKYDDEYVLANYQYIQTLDLTKEEIKGLAEYTINWIKNICSGNKKYALTYLLGVKTNEDTLESLTSSCGNSFSKVICKNSNMLEDGFIQRKIYNYIKESIKQAKLGKIWVRGNYSFMISDPVAQCRNALGLNPSGLLDAKEVYSNFWNLRNPNTKLDLCRSPMVDFHEHNICSLKKSDECDKWYKYIYSGIIYNIYDTSTTRHSDSDFDGDLCMSTDNIYFLKGAMSYLNPILYDKEMVPTQRITHLNKIKCDIKGLDTKVGQITNYSTSMVAMLPLFKKDSQEEQYKELIKRIKLLRELIGAEIDKIKGTTPPNFPKSWKKYININESDNDIVKSEKYKYNSMVVKKKPYFFIYLYKHLMKDYNNYKKAFDKKAQRYCGCSIKQLINKREKNDIEMEIVRQYQKFSPVLETECVMNRLCKTIESCDFDIKFNPNSNSMLLNFYKDYLIDDNKMTKLIELFKEYKHKKHFNIKTMYTEEDYIDDADLNSLINNINNDVKEEYKEKMFLLFDNVEEEFQYLIRLFIDKKINIEFIWEIMGDEILNIIPINNPLMAINDEIDYDFEYLGKKVKVINSNKEKEEDIC